MVDISDIVKALSDIERYKNTHRLEYYTPYPKQKEFHNAKGKGTNLPASQRLLLGGNQIGKCNSISVKIETDGGEKRLSEVWGRECNVLTYPNKEPRKVVAWVRKPPEECFRIVLSDGRWVECPKGHMILTAGGAYVPLGQLLPFLPGYAASEQDYLKNALRGARRLFGTLRGLKDRCFGYFRLYGGQLLYDQEGVQVFSPLPSGVRGRTLIWYSLDGLVNKCTNILQRVFAPLSSSYVGRRISAPYASFYSRSVEHTSQPIVQKRQEVEQSYDFANPEKTVHETTQGQQSSLRALLSPLTIDGNNIITVYSVGVHTLYDMEVEDRHNYIAGGLVHHNTFSGAMETAIHLTGRYPDWWEGTRYLHPVEFMIGSNTNETARDIVQKELFGNPMSDKELGTGTIPIDCIGKTHRKAGVPNAIDSALVKHVTGGWSKVYIRAYEQGFKKFMGIRAHGGWLDEEPPPEIWSQFIRMGLAMPGSILYITETPEEGMTEVVSGFMNNLSYGQAIIQAGWDDAPHMTDEVKQQRLKAFPAHEREMRSKGSPLMGAGLVFDVPDDDILIDPFDIPRHWPQITGIDFGWDHPFGAGKIAWDRESDCVYLVNDYRETRALPVVHAQSINAWGEWVPVTWPHDGLNTEKGTGIQLRQQYLDAGLNMLPWKATNPPSPGQKEGEGGNSVEASLMEMLERMQTGRFKVFKTCKYFMEEKRMYHRAILESNGARISKLVKMNDDVISAVRYAIMMLRHARTMTVAPRKQVSYQRHTNWG